MKTIVSHNDDPVDFCDDYFDDQHDTSWDSWEDYCQSPDYVLNEMFGGDRELMDSNTPDRD